MLVQNCSVEIQASDRAGSDRLGTIVILFMFYSLGILLPMISGFPQVSSEPSAPPERQVRLRASESDSGEGADKGQTSPLELEILELLNHERERRELAPLAWEPILADVARTHSQAMLEQRFFSHTAPDGSTPMTRLSLAHSRPILLAAENLWAGTNYPQEQIARAIIESWLKSPSHRENMLNQDARFTGVGVASAGRNWRVTTLFADFRT
jgi:uncharacterized protein YkwD